MKQTFAIWFLIALPIMVCGQVNEKLKLIDMAKAYKSYMFMSEPPKTVTEQLSENLPANLTTTCDFIIQTITTKKNILTPKYLVRPTNDELKQVYIIYELFSRMGKGNEIDFALVIDSISADTPQQYELVDNYYRMLFTAVGNKNKPFNLSKINLDLNTYKLADDTERGILFFRCMQLCGANIWGFMNIPKPPNTEAALKLIKLFPKINGQPYYQFTNFDFKDFEMVITAKDGKQSYKKYFLDKYYETLLAHYACLQSEDASEKEKNNLLLSSILKDKELYRYSKQQRTLERLFLELK